MSEAQLMGRLASALRREDAPVRGPRVRAKIRVRRAPCSLSIGMHVGRQPDGKNEDFDLEIIIPKRDEAKLRADVEPDCYDRVKRAKEDCEIQTRAWVAQKLKVQVESLPESVADWKGPAKDLLPRSPFSWEACFHARFGRGCRKLIAVDIDPVELPPEETEDQASQRALVESATRAAVTAITSMPAEKRVTKGA